jgi:two-component system, OmpR family, phosphate regulon response regulator PhoB
MTQDQDPPEEQGSTPSDGRALGDSQQGAGGHATRPVRRRGAVQAGKVLLVDDDAPLRLLVTTTLATKHFEILEAERGEQALQIIWEEHPRLILLDIKLPDMSGIEICRRIKSDPTMAHTKVVMLTAVVTDGEREAALAAGADRYITKPFSPLNLIETVTQLLGALDPILPGKEI